MIPAADRFAIIVHSYPVRPGRRFRPAVFNFDWWNHFAPPRVSALTGIGSPSGRAEGCLLSLNYETAQLQHLPAARLLKKTIKAGQKASRLGARIIGMGLPLLKALGPASAAVTRGLDSTVTDGAGCAAAAAIDGFWKAADLMGLNPEETAVLIVGAAGSVGSACTQILARDGVNYLTLIDTDRARLDRLASRVLYDYGVACKISAQVESAIARADLIILAGGTALADLDASRIKPGAVVCNLSTADEFTSKIISRRPDVMIFDQAVLRLPGGAVLSHDPVLPAGSIRASLAEAILLALEGRFDRYFIGSGVRLETLIKMRHLSRKHGFALSGFAALDRYFDFTAVKAIRDLRPA